MIQPAMELRRNMVVKPGSRVWWSIAASAAWWTPVPANSAAIAKAPTRFADATTSIRRGRQVPAGRVRWQPARGLLVVAGLNHLQVRKERSDLIRVQATIWNRH
jgi:hypothetical protein